MSVIPEHPEKWKQWMNSVELIKCGTNDCKSRLHGCSCYLDDNNSTSTEYIFICVWCICVARMLNASGSRVTEMNANSTSFTWTSRFPLRKDFHAKKNSNQCYHIGSAFGETHVSTMTRNEWAFKALWNIYVQNMYSTMLRIKSQRQEAKENERKSQTNGNIPVGMKFPRTHNNATHLDISKYVYTFLLNKVCSVLVPRWFLWKQFAICLCHFRVCESVSICDILYIDLSITWKKRRN